MDGCKIVKMVAENGLNSSKFEAEYNCHQDLSQSHLFKNELQSTDNLSIINEESFQNIKISLNRYKDISDNKHIATYAY